MPYLNYTTDSLNRQAEQRTDAAWIERILANPDSLIWVFWRDMPLINMPLINEGGGQAAPAPVSVPAGLARELIAKGALYVAAGTLDTGTLNKEQPVLALDLSEPKKEGPATEDPPQIPGGSFLELRPFASGLDPQQASVLAPVPVLAYVRSLFVWHRSYRFCGFCGSPTAPREHGHSRRCKSAACGKPHFPRLNPAVIMLVTAADRALLARNVNFPQGLHSVLAGFVEHGESPEQAVVREVREEVGLEIDTVTYVSSQPWPFTNSLMLGYHAEIEAKAPPEITIDAVEIESARWWTREQLRAEKDNPNLIIPPRDAIARQLLDRWLLDPVCRAGL